MLLACVVKQEQKSVEGGGGLEEWLEEEGDRLGNRHCSLWIAALPFSLLDFSSALILSCVRPVGSLRAVLQKFNSLETLGLGYKAREGSGSVFRQEPS